MTKLKSCKIYLVERELKVENVIILSISEVKGNPELLKRIKIKP